MSDQSLLLTACLTQPWRCIIFCHWFIETILKTYIYNLTNLKTILNILDEDLINQSEQFSCIYAEWEK